MPVHFVHAELDQSVGKQNARALIHVFSQRLEGGADQRSGAGNLARRYGHALARFQQHRLVILQLRGPNLRPLQIAQDAQRLAQLAAHLANHLNQRQLLLVGSVGKVQAGHVQTGAHKVAEDCFGVGHRAERCNYLGAALDYRVAQAKVSKLHRMCSGFVPRGWGIRAINRFYSTWAAPPGPCPAPGGESLTAAVEHIRSAIAASSACLRRTASSRSCRER